MNVGSLHLQKKTNAMKASLLIKSLIILPLILFTDYVIMVLLGCSNCLLGFGEGFNCNRYCLIGKAILLVSALLFGFLIFPDIKHIIKHQKSA